ncbi:aldehyde dehydrogenase family protein [Rhizobium leguminosarum bv. viciae]|uniref:NAD-dependent succinate-semialdehyde dehydrogenase n=1 Tax=Rhizobium leguminosarum TaxID=384 RepID=UPI0014428C60|nr:NAD-dependent succinate-semialdehyde dehydrogenase [Rhizobium leguminosarum]NKJ94745.1 aldehyde dehydrogenase family protein [Rhizobium leguminosarum bv. viciae]
MREITTRPSEAFEKTDYPPVGMYIDGEWIYDRETWRMVRNPSTENDLGPVPKATDADLDRVLQAAQKGFLIWRDTPPNERVKIIRKAVALIRERIKDIARILTLENGKTLSAAEAEIDRCCNFFEWDAAESVRSYGLIVPSEAGSQKLLLKQPIGPVLALTPWNVPMSSAARKCGAALAAGCSVILKPAVETPGTACAMVKCFEDAGLPAGVLNLVLGDSGQISTTLIGSPITRLVTFTGSTEVGKHLTELAARAMKPVLMELGGNAPVIIGEGVDVDRVAVLSAEAKTRANGLICASASRFIIHESVYKRFVDRFAEALSDYRVGDGFDPAAQMGPLANSRRLETAREMVLDAVERGGRVATGGNQIGNRGYYFEPTVLADVPLDAQAMTIEPFNPIAACVSIPDMEAAIKIANSVDVGLAGYAFTNSLAESERLQREVEVGILSINHFGTPDADTPFGGVKDSGIGREGGPSALDAYLVQKTVLLQASLR